MLRRTLFAALVSALCLVPARSQDSTPAKPETPAKGADQDKDQGKDQGKGQGEGRPPEAKPDAPKPGEGGEPGAEGVTKLPGITVDINAKTIEIQGSICRQRSPQLEVLACTPRGKTHESLLLVDCAAEHLQLGLILLGLEAAPQVKHFGEVKALEGPRVVIEVEWKDEDKKVHRHRVEDLIWDRRRQRAMERAGFVFTGSRQVEVPAPPDFETKKKVFAAKYSGNVGVLYHDPDAILDTPLLEGGDDTIFVPHADKLPPRMTPVVIYLRPWKDGDEKGSPDDGKEDDPGPLRDAKPAAPAEAPKEGGEGDGGR